MNDGRGQQNYNRTIHLLAQVAVVLAFLVICLGGTTKSKEAGLTIPQPVYYEWHYDWLFVENLNAEYTHRAVVPILSAVTLLLAGLVLVKDSRSSVKKLAVFAVVVLLMQAVLGALTVQYFAKAQTSIPHAVLGQIFLCLIAALAVTTSPAWLSDKKAVRSPGAMSVQRLGLYCIIALFMQLLLGAALRHDGQAAALRSGQPSVFVWHLCAHIMGAFAAAFFIARLISRVFQQHRGLPEIFKPTRLLMMLLGVQLLLGMGSAALKVLTLEQYDWPPFSRVLVATTHLATGAMMLALSVVITLRAHRFTEPVAAEASDASADPLGVAA